MTAVDDQDPALRLEALADQARVDPVGLTVDLVTSIDPGLDPQTVRDVVTGLAAGRAKVRRLAAALAQRPAVLCDGRSPAPLAVGELLVALRAAGGESISAPLCARCDRPLRGSMVRRGQDWCCHPCGRDRDRCTGCGHHRAVSRRDRHGRPYCPHCRPADAEDPQALLVDLITGLDPSLGADTVAAAVERAAPAPAARQRLASTIRTQPDLLTGHGHQAPQTVVLRLIDELAAAGAQAIVRPACPGCGRVAPLTCSYDGQRVCRRCSIAARAQPCTRCGHDREPAARDQHGQPLCSRCLLNDPVNQQPCSRCGRCRPVEAQTADGPVCPSCRPARVLTCAICGRTGPAEISRVTGQPWCTACQQRWARCTRCGVAKPVRSGTLEAPLCAGCTDTEQLWQACPTCGAAERLAGGPCRRCTLGDRVHQLLADDEGVVTPELQPLQQALAGAERTATVLNWLHRSAAAEVLASLGRGTRPLSHDALDELAPEKTVEHLRSVLVATRTLPERDEQLMRLERWITATLDAVPDPERRHLLQHYAVRHLLRRLRTRNRNRPTTHGQATGIRQRVRAAEVLLEWLAGQRLTLANCQQADLDRWLASDQARYRLQASGFVRWAVTTRRTTSRLQGLDRTWNGPAELLDSEQRWAQARRLLHDDSLELDDRVAGLLVLLYAQRAATIAQLSTADVDTENDVVRLHLGATPVELPEPAADLVRALLATRAGHATIGQPATTGWLFPGGQPARPVSAAQMGPGYERSGYDPTRPVQPPCSGSPPRSPPRSLPARSASPSTSPSTGNTSPAATGPATPPKSAAEPAPTPTRPVPRLGLRRLTAARTAPNPAERRGRRCRSPADTAAS